jgi:Domain of unknown function (DUF4258)
MMILDIKQIEAQIRRIARIGSVAFEPRCKRRVKERNVDSLDVLMVLKSGVITHEIDPDNEMKFRVVGQDLTKEKLTVIIDLCDEDSLSAITVW